jgi:ABC-type transport system substrate-binding protein
MAINKRAMADWRRVVKPLTAFTPEGIFPGYPQPRGDGFDPERAKQLLAEAGYRDASGRYDPSKFPVSEVELLINAHESVRLAAEFIQQQWKQNLGITVPIRSMEFKTYLKARNNLEFKGFSRGGWGADFLDPFAFLSLLYSAGGNNGTGWSDPKYAALLDEANRTPDGQKRYELLARAEAYMLEAQPVIPLYTPATNWIKKPYVKGLYPNPGTLHAWKYVYIEPDPAKWHESVAEIK